MDAPCVVGAVPAVASDAIVKDWATMLVVPVVASVTVATVTTKRGVR